MLQHEFQQCLTRAAATVLTTILHVLVRFGEVHVVYILNLLFSLILQTPQKVPNV